MSADREKQTGANTAGQSELIEPLGGEPPMFTNGAGVQWWHEKSLTQYAERKGLRHVTAWRIKEPNGRMTRLLTREQEVLIDDQSLEQFSCKIDMLALVAKAL